MTVDRIPENGGIHGVNSKNHVFLYIKCIIMLSDSYEGLINLPNISVWQN